MFHFVFNRIWSSYCWETAKQVRIVYIKRLHFVYGIGKTCPIPLIDVRIKININCRRPFVIIVDKTIHYNSILFYCFIHSGIQRLVRIRAGCRESCRGWTWRISSGILRESYRGKCPHIPKLARTDIKVIRFREGNGATSWIKMAT